MTKEEIEERINVCEIKANEYREVGKTKTSEKYENEKYKWEQLLNQIKPISKDYQYAYFHLKNKIDKAIEYIKHNNEKFFNKPFGIDDKFFIDLLYILGDEE